MRRFTQAGFSLIELMIAIAVVGILTTVAVPTYRNHVIKSHRADALIALMEIAQRQERFFSEKNSYTNNLFDTDSASNACRGIIYSVPDDYTLTVTTTTTPVINYNGGTGACTVATVANDFSVTATASGRQADDHECATLAITSQGVTSSKDSDGNSTDCW